MTDPLGRATRHVYDGLGRRVSTIDAAGRTTTFAYDERGRLTRTTYPDGTFTQSGYDAVGRQTSSTDQSGVTTTYGYDAEGQILSVTDALGNVTRYEYDGAGNLTKITDANAKVTKMAYSVRNDLERRIQPSGAVEDFRIGAMGILIERTDPRGLRTQWRFDTMDRLVSTGGTDVPATDYILTPTGKRKETTRSGFVTHRYAYDSRRDRLIRKETPEGTLNYTYDPAGNVATMRSSRADGVNVSYEWDAANQLVSVTDHRVPGGLTVANYTLTGQTAAVTPPTGVTATYTRDALDRVTNLAHAPGGGSPLASYAYALGPAGHRLSVTELSGRSATYGYDVAHRLTSETVAGDPAGPNGAVGYTHRYERIRPFGAL